MPEFCPDLPLQYEPETVQRFWFYKGCLEKFYCQKINISEYNLCYRVAVFNINNHDNAILGIFFTMFQIIFQEVGYYHKKVVVQQN